MRDGVGAAAHKMTMLAGSARPRLVVVKDTRRGRPARKARNVAARRFRVISCALCVLAMAGIVRVSLAAKAAEAAVDAAHLREQLKVERLAGRELEADRSTLAAPSRIEVIACETLNMGRPQQVCYLELPGDAPVTAADRMPDEVQGPGSGIISTLMDLAAGEAQVLLVGDMGLGSGR